MKRQLSCAVAFLVALAVHAAFADDPPSPTITGDEVAALIKDIDTGQATLLGLIAGMTDEQWNFQENPDRWSTGECVEHITRTEVAILNGIKNVVVGPADPQWFEKTDGKMDLVRRVAVSRSPGGVGSPFKAGGEVLPTEHWDRARGFEEFYRAHGQLRAFVETMNREIKNRVFDNPFPQIGSLNAHQWLTLAALHVSRHSLQIEEIKRDPNYPKSPTGVPQNAAAGKAPSPFISDEELAELFEEFNLSENTLLAAVTGLSDEQWNFRENPERWSIGECIEHIVRGEAIILQAIQNVMAGPPDPQWYTRTEGKQNLVRQSVLSRPKGGAGSPFKAPYEVSPAEQWTRQRGILRIYESHGVLRAYLETMPRDLKNRTFENPFPQIGWMNCHDWLLLTALHIRRHCMQIDEIKQDPNYPKSGATTAAQ